MQILKKLCKVAITKDGIVGCRSLSGQRILLQLSERFIEKFIPFGSKHVRAFLAANNDGSSNDTADSTNDDSDDSDGNGCSR